MIIIPSQHQAAPKNAPKSIRKAVSTVLAPGARVTNLDIDDDGRFRGIQRVQDIPEETYRDLAELRSQKSWKGQETVKIAEVPYAWIESLWQRGINIMDMDIKTVVQLMKAEGLDDFLASKDIPTMRTY